MSPEDFNRIRINWLEDERSGSLSAYQAEIGCRLAPYIHRPNRDPGESELKYVAWLIRDAAIKTLSHDQPRKFRDQELSKLCIKSKEA